MCSAAKSAKRLASPVLASIDRPNKLTKKVEEEKLKSRPPPQDTLPGGVGPFHPTGVVMEIVGTERSDQGRSCEEHLFNCGEVLAEDVVVRLHTHNVEHARFVLIRAVGAALGDEMRPIVK